MPQKHLPIAPILVAISIIVLAIFNPFSSKASHAESLPSHITVTGEGIAKAKPDQATFSLYFNDSDMDVEKARARVELKVSTLLSSLSQFKVKDSSIDSSQVNINPQYDYRKSERIFRGYQLNRTVQFTLLDITQLSDVVSMITKVGPSGMNGITMGLQDRSELESTALTNAINHSKILAKQIAKNYGVSVGKVHQVAYNQAPHFELPRTQLAMARESASDNHSFNQKELEIRATVTASFNIE